MPVLLSFFCVTGLYCAQLWLLVKGHLVCRASPDFFKMRKVLFTAACPIHQGRDHLFLFSDEGTEGQIDEVTYPEPHGLEVVELFVRPEYC